MLSTDQEKVLLLMQALMCAVYSVILLEKNLWMLNKAGILFYGQEDIPQPLHKDNQIKSWWIVKEPNEIRAQEREIRAQEREIRAQYIGSQRT